MQLSVLAFQNYIFSYLNFYAFSLQQCILDALTKCRKQGQLRVFIRVELLQGFCMITTFHQLIAPTESIYHLAFTQKLVSPSFTILRMPRAFEQPQSVTCCALFFSLRIAPGESEHNFLCFLSPSRNSDSRLCPCRSPRWTLFIFLTIVAQTFYCQI